MSGQHDDRPRCGIPLRRLSRGGRITRVTCRNLLAAGQVRCTKHLDLFAWATSERKVLERRREKLRARMRRWSVEKLAALAETRQLDLLVWTGAYGRLLDRLIRSLIDRRTSDNDRMPEWPGLDAGRAELDRYRYAWDAYERRREAQRQEWERLEEDARLAADREALEAQWPAWGTLRRLVYERDRGVCFVCDRAVAFEYFELGHLQDRMMGGSDHPDNVVVMCYTCNHLYKPLHETGHDAREWAAICRAEFRRQRSVAAPMSETEFLAHWSGLAKSEREALVDQALGWPDQVEEARRELRAALAESDGSSASGFPAWRARQRWSK